MSQTEPASTKPEVRMVKIDAETHALLRELAALEDRTLGAIVRRAVNAYAERGANV